ncbi:MAG: hypothetical protein PHU12_03515 [Candidatus Aenigmarchaeota archaeon]|nr:hypothetical protein [Candidatus Aenigmarchaeota archaeon]
MFKKTVNIGLTIIAIIGLIMVIMNIKDIQNINLWYGVILVLLAGVLYKKIFEE